MPSVSTADVDVSVLTRATEHSARIAVLESRAERLLSEYLRRWGLRDPSTIAAHCRLWAWQATETVDGPLSRRSTSNVYSAAMHGAISEIDEWLDHLASLV